ncbi:hypothetical protein GCM10027073_13730 [Streptomyces chlorus]|uniref:Uncharacterized protein n=1 Tax=Streptomyces chlorus TaxID=887452 RepID=A0ABW1DPZ2_9ACTN
MTPGGRLVGLEPNCTHHRAAREGLVAGGPRTALHPGSRIGAHQLTIRDDHARLIRSARLTCLLREGAGADR